MPLHQKFPSLTVLPEKSAHLLKCHVSFPGDQLNIYCLHKDIWENLLQSQNCHHTLHPTHFHLLMWCGLTEALSEALAACVLLSEKQFDDENHFAGIKHSNRCTGQSYFLPWSKLCTRVCWAEFWASCIIQVRGRSAWQWRDKGQGWLHMFLKQLTPICRGI
jgi:hypothetical protein